MNEYRKQSIMLFRCAIFAAIVACVTAKSLPKSTGDIMIPDFDIPTESKIGKKLLSKARRLDDGNEQEADWLAGYSIMYYSCSSLIQVREEGGNEDEGILYTQNLVKFVVCPGNAAGSCNDCGDGIAQYVVNMMEFVEAYTEMKLEQQEYACEMIAEYCYCDNANDEEVCENQCYVDAGMDVCIEYENGDDFEIQEFLECDEMEGADGNDNNNNNGNYNYGQQTQTEGVNMYLSYYVGPLCSPDDGKSIFLAAFFDAGCTSYAGTGVYEAFHYGYPLPYENEPIVTLDDCISCLQVDQDNDDNNNNNNNNYNNNQDQEVSELCQQSYEMAAKCESNLGSYLGQYYYTDVTGCEYINNILPNLEQATRKISSGNSRSGFSGGGGAATACAVIFALTSLLLGAYAFFLYRKIHRAKVNLAQAEMGIA
mmetsp:Transcript_49993/g.53967  ORF Transcript_49993/g.53967 Transcript_49993/m.53967 type:complete len:425 (-) Transcript_49993:165-1439(-)